MELYPTENNPVPEGAEVASFEGRGGVAIRYALWRPPAGRNRGTICLFGGRGEYIEKYFETIGELRRRGFGVATMDWRGQGGSQRLLRNPRKGFVDSFVDYDADLRKFMHEVVMPDCTPPYFGLGHSTGAHILLRSSRRHAAWFERLVLIAPLIALPVGRMRQGMICVAAEILTYVGFGPVYAPGAGRRPTDFVPLEKSRQTHDAARLERNANILRQAPQLAVGGPTIQWVQAACRSMRELARPEFPQTVGVPLLIFGGTEEKVVSQTAMERLAHEIRVGSYLMIPGARHEILMESDRVREEFWAAFDVFVPGTPGFGTMVA
jgi:lysophospholipase